MSRLSQTFRNYMQETSLKTRWVNRFGLDPQDLNVNMGDGTMPSPNDYIEAGVDPDRYLSWYQVGGFDIDRMLALEDAGIDIELTGALTSEGCGNYQASIAYKYCNGDIDLVDVKKLAKIHQ
jgi:hypothetical protein